MKTTKGVMVLFLITYIFSNLLAKNVFKVEKINELKLGKAIRQENLDSTMLKKITIFNYNNYFSDEYGIYLHDKSLYLDEKKLLNYFYSAYTQNEIRLRRKEQKENKDGWIKFGTERNTQKMLKFDIVNNSNTPDKWMGPKKEGKTKKKKLHQIEIKVLATSTNSFEAISLDPPVYFYAYTFLPKDKMWTINASLIHSENIYDLLPILNDNASEYVIEKFSYDEFKYNIVSIMQNYSKLTSQFQNKVNKFLSNESLNKFLDKKEKIFDEEKEVLQNEISKLSLEPKDEFENNEEYEVRIEKANLEKKTIEDQSILKIEEKNTKLAEELLSWILIDENKITESITETTLKIENIGQYNADKETFPITINDQIKEIYLPRGEAKSFKENWTEINVKAMKKFKRDLINYEYYDIIIIHPITGNEYLFD